MKEVTAVNTEQSPVSAPLPRIADDPASGLNARVHHTKGSSARKESRSPFWLPIGFGLVFLMIWQLKGFHTLFRLELYQLPIPSSIAKAIQANSDLLWSYSLYTGAEMIGGCLIGSAIGLFAAVAASFGPQAGKGAITLLAALNAVPIVALAPVMNNWFGDGVASKIAIVSIMTMATMAVSAYKGLRSVEPAYLELMHAYAAGRFTIFLKLRFRLALPTIFTALKINMATGIIGAIVGEFFISSRGLGFLLSDQIKLGNMPIAWSCIVIAAVLGIVLYYCIQLIERLAVPWHVAQRKRQ
ncbi:ABC transporter permease [Paenibacillus glycanilyticus]|uniref:ABC transporter permease n=1 Tax=Paenibacillus glycanilyticus TaxID=126569 RepID=UPI00203E7A9A|nr:ABC transporter permease [Paenibacillus glycanilyticus]MCM3631533.1 ABC transporter permease [Paenibacillus glycanilyticus]